ncbi:MAG: hypothetical protein J6O55_04280 [Lachnospiraceae bacterium]|nr:hypothetical protein [Lachnospiraceae bacterium]
MAENDGIFREKSMQRLSSPEQLNDYIKVSSAGMWLVLIGIILILVGALVWATFGTVTLHTADGTAEVAHPISFVVN